MESADYCGELNKTVIDCITKEQQSIHSILRPSFPFYYHEKRPSVTYITRLLAVQGHPAQSPPSLFSKTFGGSNTHLIPPPLQLPIPSPSQCL